MLWVAPIGALLIAFALMVAPFPNDLHTVRAIGRILLAPAGSRVVIGNSVVDHYSVCDKDRRSLPELLAAGGGRNTVDLSWGGQALASEIGVAELALRSKRISDVVIFVSPFQLQASEAIDPRNLAFFSILRGDTAAIEVASHLTSGMALDAFGGEQPGFDYKGRHYPNYEGFKQQYFTRERVARRCPEHLGVNLAAIEAFYWNSYGRVPLVKSSINDLLRLRQRAFFSGKRLTIVVLPIDYDDIRSLDPALANSVIARMNDMLTELGDSALNLTNSVPGIYFADRWCACGHLSEHGRQIVIARVIHRTGHVI